MMSDESTSQLLGTLVTKVALLGVLVVSGLRLNAANTLGRAVVGELRSYHETFKRPFASALRSAGRKCRPPLEWLLSLRGALWTGERLPSAKLCIKMSPSGCSRASFQTMLTVPYLSLTAIRGKSFAGKRL